ncbi:MAG: chromosome segregation protein SMC [Elusimicrobia bacterium CG1_02_63_36]|nr:MAG: chromosome segregation protein SMC [Elusimicrobia bacterium CG1_02_63_36]PIP82529.1 MAG: chromosome segregation protein SMC [Elusimicrobia bacterium CG22_combo_CG10-13_8_21_14_all_63_91]PJA15239.1 MAG: chromosome segregation protein SMC [Elusimicrobia bacterium CG_4_10_14_0_2_um_filter_63_34]PJB26501.1 MAG: chromosome segregation protein SMC [Elusimicrobia bacterium CG_4_9_14_3_um_filter_62_55]
MATKNPNGKKPGSSRKFRKLYLENWRNFPRAEIDLGNRVFFIGPNASGKSNLLDAFRFLRDIVSVGGGFQQAVKSRGGVSAIRSLAARQNPDIVIRVEVADGAISRTMYELRFAQDNQRRPFVRKETVIRNGRTLFERPDKDDKVDEERLIQTYLEQVNVNKEFRDLSEFFSSTHYLHIVPQLVREPDRSVGKRNDPFGGDFLEQIANTPEKTKGARLRRIQKALRVAVPQLVEIKLDKDKKGTPHLYGKYQHWRPQGAWQTEDQFSDGTLRLLGLLWAVLDGSGPLLLEEPELSLHPEVVRYIPQLFARIQRHTGRQIILSTHSADLLRDEGIGIDEVSLLMPGNEGSEVKAANTIAQVKELLEGGVPLPEIVMPRTKPENAEQLSLFGDSL